MNKKQFLIVVLIVTMILSIGCNQEVIGPALNDEALEEVKVLPETTQANKTFSGEIYLYGEIHGEEKILEKELEIWSQFYHEQGMRHLFIEHAYYTAEFLNLWMASQDDEILDALYEDWSGTASHTPAVKTFYKDIKAECPETIFHGTDIGHQYHSTGQRFIEYLKKNDLEDSEVFALTEQAISQGKSYYEDKDHANRENLMVKNFLRASEGLTDENIMGIYGRSHTGFDAMDITGSVPSMATQLKEIYGNQVHTESLLKLSKMTKAIRRDIITIQDKEYQGLYFGQEDLKGHKDYVYREFWRLMDAYDDFKDFEKTGDVLPFLNYPMVIDEGQVFRIDYTHTDGQITRKYYISEGLKWNDLPSTEEIRLNH